MNEFLHKKTNIPYNSYLSINMTLLRKNVRELLQQLPAGCKLIPVLKDDAYGMGLVPVAKLMQEFPEIQLLAVANVSEGLMLRESGITCEILIMSAALPTQISAAVQAHLTLTVGRPGMVTAIAREAEHQGCTAPVQIAIDGGLHRIGFMPGPMLAEFIAELREQENFVTVTGCFAHCANGDSDAACQTTYREFSAGLNQLREAGIPTGLRHFLASASLESHPEYAMDGVRIGRRLYMNHPDNPVGNIQEVPTWTCYITAVNLRCAGSALGYGGKVQLSRDSKIATISVGYGDGLRPELAEVHSPVLIHGVRCPLLFSFMDQSVVDVTDVPCETGDAVTIFGYDETGTLLPSQEIAKQIGVLEGVGLTSALSNRVGRVYTEE